MSRNLICLALVAGTALFQPAPALAGESYDNCTGFITSLPATITAPGIWCLDRDLATAIASGNAITISANNVTFECNHFKIGGLAAGAGTLATGIRAVAALNATVRNCNLRGFLNGTNLVGGGHLVEGSRFDGNTYIGILLGGTGSTARNNLVNDTGGSSLGTNFAAGIWAIQGADVIDNSVNGVAPSDADSSAVGLYTDSNGEGSVIANRVRGVMSTGSGMNVGILNTSGSGRIAVRDNTIQGPGVGIGIFCNTNLGSAQNNVIAGYVTGVQFCQASSNVVNPN